MKLAILSDLHDNYTLWQQKILPKLKELGIEQMIFCGDMCAPGVMKKLAQEFGGKIDLVYGNVDGDKEKMRELAQDLSNLEIHGEEGKIEVLSKRIFFTHYPKRAYEVAEIGGYDLVCFGHTHQVESKKVGEILMVNPGTSGGLFANSTFMIYDLETGEIEIINV